MNLFLKGFIIGIAKIIPGVSGAMIAVNFLIYDKLINAITNFFDNKRENFRLLLLVFSGVLLSIVCFSNIIIYFIKNYYIIIMMFFVGLIVGGTYSYSKSVKFNFKNIIIIGITIFIVLFISVGNIRGNYVLNNTWIDYLVFFIGGVIEIFASIVPGISGTALMMMFGLYDNILMMFSNLFNFSFLINNIFIYISYGVGMGVSFIIFSILISYLLKKYRNIFDTVVFGLSISSIILLVIMTFSNGFLWVDFCIGIILFFIGIVVSYLFSN